MRTMSLATSGLWGLFSLNKVIANNASRNITQVGTKKCKTRSFICESHLLHLLNDGVHSFHNIGIWMVQTRFEIVIFWRVWKLCVKNKKLTPVTFWYIDGLDFSQIETSHYPSRFSYSGKKFKRELSVLSGKIFADALETKSIKNQSIVIWL